MTSIWTETNPFMLNVKAAHPTNAEYLRHRYKNERTAATLALTYVNILGL
jgi:hypothetical protein